MGSRVYLPVGTELSSIIYSTNLVRFLWLIILHASVVLRSRIGAGAFLLVPCQFDNRTRISLVIINARRGVSPRVKTSI